jgi:hypothetical protein
MPALIHNSPAFTTTGIALLSQGAVEQPTGLVRVNVEYSLTQARVDSPTQGVNTLFVHDAPPPIYPTVYPVGSLQGGRLFLESYTLQKSFGQWRVSASYVGARLPRANFGGFIVRKKESRVTPPYKVPDVATISARFVAQVVETSIASLGGGFFDTGDLSTGIGEIESRISRLQYGSISFAGTDLSVPPEERQRLVDYNFLPSPRVIFLSFRPAVRTSTSVSNVTNSIVIATTVRDIVFLQDSN